MLTEINIYKYNYILQFGGMFVCSKFILHIENEKKYLNSKTEMQKRK